MKNIYKSISIIALSLFILLGVSCKKSFYTRVNKNPNAPASVVPSVLLSTVEASLAYIQGGDMSRYTSMLVQQTKGVSRQSSAYYTYVFTTQDFDAQIWPNLYTQVMENDYTLMKLADGGKNNAYSGIARLIMAYTLQIGVDCWGKMPYSQAFQGVNNLHPAYDNDKDLYAAISGLVDAGIADLNNTSGDALSPSAEDVIYGGNAKAWIKFGHAIKARLYMHQSKGNPTMATNALTEIGMSFSSNADNAVYTFGTTETSANPYYQFNTQRGDMSFSSSTLGLQLLSSHDPRYHILIDSTNDAAGTGLAAYYGSISAPVELICYDELLFDKAEANLTISGSSLGSQLDYVAAMAANMQKLGVDSNSAKTYIASHAVLSAVPATALSQIATQANIALYLNPEAWTTWRRTGYPVLTPAGGSNGVPRRFLYPLTEIQLNGANTPSATLWSPKVFWDN